MVILLGSEPANCQGIFMEKLTLLTFCYHMITFIEHLWVEIYDKNGIFDKKKIYMTVINSQQILLLVIM